MLGSETLEALGQVDWTKPSFSDAELDEIEHEEARRSETDRR